MRNKKVVGIVGGMGPEATVDLFKKIIKATPALKDQDHLRILIDNNTSVPDRTNAINGDGPSPVEEIKKSLKFLESGGAEIFAMPCNTAHYYYNELKNEVDGEFIHMMNEVAYNIKDHFPSVKKVGILATTGTLNTKLYHKALERMKLEVIEPKDNDQLEVMEAIYAPWGIKAGKYKDAKTVLKRVCQKLITDGADLIIMGCTEIPLALDQTDAQVELLDATQVLANAIVAKAFK
ncbi:MAG: aspartate/glutamate racemase family protein [Clostridia bacterium]